MSASTPVDTVRPTGTYALVDGRWWESSSPLPGRPLVIRVRATERPSPGFTPSSKPGLFTREVDKGSVTKAVSVRTECSYHGGRFEVLPSGKTTTFVLRYVGDDQAWALGLSGFTKGAYYETSGEITGEVARDETTEVTETELELPLGS